MSVLTPADREWHERRRLGVGGSEVAAVVGRHPYASPWSVWARKVGLIDDADDQPADVDAARFGRDVEALGALYFHERTGLHVAGEQMMLTKPGQPWARCTVDGLVFDHDVVDVDDLADPIGVLELKYTGQPRPPDGLAEHHRLQVQWQLYVSGLEHGWVATIRTAFGRLAFEVVEVERDDALLAELAPAVERFWLDHVVTGNAPPADGSDATTDAIKAVFGEPVSAAGSVDLDDDARAALDVLRQAKAEAKVLAGVIAEAENTLRVALGEHSEGRVGGWLAVSWRPQTATRVDPSKARALIGDAADVTTTSRVLRLHKGGT